MTHKNNRKSNTPSAKSNETSSVKSSGSKRPREEVSEDEDTAFESSFDSKHVKRLKQMIADCSDDSINKNSDSEDDDEYVEKDSNKETASEDDDADIKETPTNAVKCETQEKSVNKKQPLNKIVSEKPTTASKQSKLSAKMQGSFSPSESNVLIFNIPRLIEKDIHNFLAKRNVYPESISCINTPIAMLGFPTDESARDAASLCSGESYKKTTIAAVPVVGSDIKMIRSNLNPHPNSLNAPLTCLFVTFLPKTVTQEQIVQVIGVKPLHVRLITSGQKNQSTNACYIDCKSEEDAKKSFQILQNHLFEDKPIKVFLRAQNNFNPITECSFIVANVPFSADIDDMANEFPSAKKVELTRKGCFMVSFENAEARSIVLKQSEGKVMEGRELRFITSEKSPTDYPVFVSNIPFTATFDELKALFPGCKYLLKKTNDDGRFNGNAIVHYATKDAAESAARDCANKELRGKTLGVNLQETTPNASCQIEEKNVNEQKPKKEKKVKSKPIAPVQMESDSGSDKEDEENAEEASDDEDSQGDDDDDASEEHNSEDGEKKVEPMFKGAKQEPYLDPQFGRGGNRGGFQHRGGGFQPRGGRGSGGFQHRGGRGGGFQRRGVRGGGFGQRGNREERGRGRFFRQ